MARVAAEEAKAAGLVEGGEAAAMAAAAAPGAWEGERMATDLT